MNGTIVVCRQSNIGIPCCFISAGKNGEFGHCSSFAIGAVQVGLAISMYEVML
jgi:hypothetical protein